MADYKKFSTGFTRLDKTDFAGKNILSDDELRASYGDLIYENNNPVFTNSVAESLSRGDCDRCYGRGVQHWNIPRKVKYSLACKCVQNRVNKMEKETQSAILGVE